MNKSLTVILFLFVVGCAPNQVIQITSTASPLPAPTLPPTLTPTLIPTATSTPTITPTPLGGGLGRIAFLRILDSFSEILVMNPDGTNISKLAEITKSYSVKLTWSPDGTKIAFSSSSPEGSLDIYVINADSGDQTNLTNTSGGINEESPVWSPDGKKIAFDICSWTGPGMSAKLDRCDIYTMNADGSNQVNITNNPKSSCSTMPAWSPDGRKIAFTFGCRSSNIYTMSVDGSEKTELTTDGISSGPVWSPDSTKIAFTSSLNGVGDVEVMNANGSEKTILFKSKKLNYPHAPLWSPDGKKIVFSFQYSMGNAELYIVNPDGTGFTNLTNLSDNPNPWDGDYYPSWSPDSTKITFSAGGGIYVINADGSERQILVSSNGPSDISQLSVWAP